MTDVTVEEPVEAPEVEEEVEETPGPEVVEVEEPTAQPVEPGARVQYHGSLTDLWGDGTVLFTSKDDHPEIQSEDGHRYVIMLDRQIPVSNVRRESFTVLDQVVEA